MNDYIKVALKLLWIILFSYWLISGFRVKKAAAMEGFFKRFFYYWFPLLIAFYLLGPGEWFGHSLIRENFVAHTNTVGLIGLTLCFIGAIVAVWSRYLLADNWSVSVQKKEDHKLIRKGPYRFIRHPIYSGLLVLFLGNAIIVGDYRGLIAVGIVFISFWLKLKKEERSMMDLFGDEYKDYMKKSKALIPGLL